MIDVKIRYNTLCDDNNNFWRIIIDGNEHICSNIIIEIPTFTTKDDVWDNNRNSIVSKHHISCMANEIVWKGDVVIIK